MQVPSTLGDTVQFAYVDQSHKDTGTDKSVWEVLSNSQENDDHRRHLGEQPRLPRPFQLHRNRTRTRKWACSPVASATACTWP
jgi:hypothetical protein